MSINIPTKHKQGSVINTYSQKRMQKTYSLSKTIIIVTLNILIFIIPWIFSIRTEEYYETTKSYLLVIAVSILMMVWGISVIIKKRVTLFKTPLDIPMLILMVVLLLSTLFSLNPDTSLWGYHMRINGGLVSYLIFIALYYLIINNIDEKDTVKKLLKTITYSISLLALFTILKTTGVLDTIFNQLIANNTSLSFIKSPYFSPVGSTNGLSLLFLIAYPISLFSMLNKKGRHILITIKGLILSMILIAATFVTTVLSTSTIPPIVIWTMFVLVTIVSIIYIQKEKTENINTKRALNVLLLLLILITFYVSINKGIGTSLVNNLRENGVAFEFEQFQELPLETTNSVISGNFNKYGIKSTLIGSGLDTYAFLFSQFRPQSQNLQPNWNSNYSVSNIQLDMLLSGTGLFGTIAIYGSLLFFTFKFIRKYIFKNRNIYSKKSIISTLLVIIIFLISYLFSYHSTTFSFFAWLIIALGIKSYIINDPDNSGKYEAQLNIVNQKKPTQNINLGTYLFGLTIIISSLILITLTTINIFAESFYNDGLNLSVDGKYDDAYDKMLAATKLNPNRDYYQSSIATVALTKLDSLFLVDSTEELSIPERDERELTANYLLNLITDRIEKAISINIENYENWQQSAVIYKRLTEIAQGTKFGTETLQSISKAISLAPNNPDNYLILGYLYQYNSDEAKQLEAERIYLKAYDLQPSYRQTIIQLGDYWESKSKYDDALNLYLVSKEKFYSEQSTMNSYLLQKINALNSKSPDIDQ